MTDTLIKLDMAAATILIGTIILYCLLYMIAWCIKRRR